MRRVSLSTTGRYVVMRARETIDIVDAIGTAPREQVSAEGVIDFACAGAQLWLLRGTALERHALVGGRSLGALVELPAGAASILASSAEGASEALLAGPTPVVAVVNGDSVDLCPVGRATAAWPLGGRRVAFACDGKLHIQTSRPALAVVVKDRDVVGVWPLFGGRTIAILSRAGDRDWWTVIQADGARVHEVEAARARWSVAATRGLAIGIGDGGDSVTSIDLRYGRCAGEGPTSLPVVELEVSADGRFAVLAGGSADAPEILHLPVADLLSGKRTLRTEPAPTVDAARVEPPAPPVRAPVAAMPRASGPYPLPRALGAPLPPLDTHASPRWEPYASPREHLDDMIELVAARTARAIAEAWNTGRLAAPIDGRPPFEHEVRGLLGHAPALSAEELSAADVRLGELLARTAGRVRSTLASGARLPFIELLRELDLSPVAGHALMVVVAPQIRGELGRLFGILGNAAGRTFIDRHLVEVVLAGDDRVQRAAVAAELADGAPLLANGVLRTSGDPSAPLHQGLHVDPVVVARIRGHVSAPRLDAVRPLEQLAIAAVAVDAVVAAVAAPRAAHEPLRLVLRGRRGSGRRSLLAALAAKVDRAVEVIDATHLPRGAGRAEALQRALCQAVLRGAVPALSSLTIDPADVEGADRIRQVLAAHPGPLVLRAAPEGSVPLAPGYVDITLPPLSETERAHCWGVAIAAAGLRCGDLDGLAARWRVGPGVLSKVIEQVAMRSTPADQDATAALDDVARQHIATRLDHVAQPMRRLARWEDVALPDDVVDSIREFIARVAHRRTVFEQWNFETKMASARGLTALFYGPPGTGKSMVAGLIARELGLELYRIDLASVVSKWIGETEKHLAEIFDAAEEGQVVVLFDEADSLFARRTEVRTSVDRYANLEVNYLLQRLDSFEGIAILTTNLDGSIDPAFKRRMSLRLQFPFPDEDMRRRLWAQHIPVEAPVAGDFDFEELARKFPLSGGYIRNCTLRAAFLAAQERVPLAHEHLARAVALEYRELGKLTTGSRME